MSEPRFYEGQKVKCTANAKIGVVVETEFLPSGRELCLVRFNGPGGVLHFADELVPWNPNVYRGARLHEEHESCAIERREQEQG